MKRIAVALTLAALGGQVRAGVSVDASSLIGLTGGYYATDAELSSPIGKGFYFLSARSHTFRYQAAAPGTREEYSAALRRELYHVSVGGRLGTSPPNMQRAAYHLVQGDLLFIFYGTALGPEHPELSALVWESSGPVPSPDSLDRTWMTKIHVIYTNTDIHMQQPVQGIGSPSLVTLVQNSWQFDVREIWRDRLGAAFQFGHDRYNQDINSTTETILIDNVRYPGSPFALRGWLNNYVSGELWQRLGSEWKISLALSKFNLLNSGWEVQYGAELERRLGSRWLLRSGYYREYLRGVESREGIALNVLYTW